MMYLLKHTRSGHSFRDKFLKRFVIFLMSIALVFVLNIFSPTKTMLANVASPFFRTGGYFYEKLSLLLNIFSDKDEIIKENTELLYKIESMRLDLVDYEFLREENQKLREELGLKPAESFITARVVAKLPQVPLDSLLIDRGSRDSLKIGSFVLAGNKFLVGKVVKMSSNGATIALSSFPNAMLYGYVARTDEPIEITGSGGGSMQAKVPIDFDIGVSDKIMVEGHATYVAAVVASIEEDSSSGFKNILMSLPANISRTKFVFVEPIIIE